jgi:hypothetical protein
MDLSGGTFFFITFSFWCNNLKPLPYQKQRGSSYDLAGNVGAFPVFLLAGIEFHFFNI